MECESLRERFYEGDEAPLRGHAAECDSCREWLRREERLAALLSDSRDDAGSAVEVLAGMLRRPDRRHAGRILRRVVITLAAAAAVIMTVAAGLLLRQGGEHRPEILPTRIVVIEGRVRDNGVPPEFIEVGGERYHVERVSATEGRWQVEVVLEGKRRDIVLSAVDASGNRRYMNIHLQR